jgi:urease subunit alpha
VGSVEVGKWADLVLWKPAFFGVKPSLVLKGGFIALAPWATPTPASPRRSRCTTGRCSAATAARCTATSLSFVSQAALAGGMGPSYGLKQARWSAVKGCRSVTKRDMVHNAWLPKMEIDAADLPVRADGSC